ncbi:MAG: Hsp20/alpha crystallin family protein [Omnitrophica WOR_2 bacterium]
MDNLTRWNPFREMMDLREAVDRMMERSFSNSPYSANMEWGLPLDVVENEDEFLVKASLPGINPDDLDITYNDRILTIKGEIKGDEGTKGSKYHLRERWAGSFSRSITLPTRVDAEHIDAKYQDGILTLHLPKTEETKPRRIQINSESPKMIEAQFNKEGNGKKK